MARFGFADGPAALFPMSSIDDPGEDLALVLTRLPTGLLRFCPQPEALATYRGVIASAGS